MHARPRPTARSRTTLPALALAVALAAGCSPGGSDAGERGRPRATIAVEPLSGPPGTDVQVRVTGFPPDVAVDVAFGPPGSDPELLSRTSTGSEGNSAAAVRVPAGAVPGRPYVFVATYAPSLLRLVSDTFTVTAPGAGPAATADTTTGGSMGSDSTSDTTTTRTGEVRVVGRLTDEGVECPALRGDDGRLYTLAGDTGGFGPGDRVTVVGTVAEMSTCMQGTTIGVRSIERTGSGG